MGAAGWNPVALSATLQAGTSTGITLDGKELVLWRDSSGAAHVWEDRCPHRGMRMSLGFVRGDHIACLYHGWQYDTGGQCRHIPAHPALDVPKTIRMTTYAVAERDGMVWTCLEDSAPAWPDAPGTSAVPLRSLYIDAAQDAVVAVFGLEPLSGTDDRAASPDLLYRLTCGGAVLRAGLQRIGAHKTGLHMVLEGPGAGAEALVELAKAVAALRSATERTAKAA